MTTRCFILYILYCNKLLLWYLKKRKKEFKYGWWPVKKLLAPHLFTNCMIKHANIDWERIFYKHNLETGDFDRYALTSSFSIKCCEISNLKIIPFYRKLHVIIILLFLKGEVTATTAIGLWNLIQINFLRRFCDLLCTNISMEFNFDFFFF